LLSNWVEAGFAPDSFWDQTPATFQAVMQGAVKRAERDAEGQIAHAYHTALFNAGTKTKAGLKPLAHYLRKPGRKMSSKEMLANMKMLAARANRAASLQGKED
jgi:hypothetical protein